MKKRNWFVSIFFVVLMLMATPLVAQAQKSSYSDSHHFAPYLNFSQYSYQGEGNEFAGREAELQFEPNENGIYQFSLNNGGTTTVYIYQLTDAGIVELAYFPETYDIIDLRTHADATDTQSSLILPREIAIGTTFTSGYDNQNQFTVIDILADYDVLGATYHDVIVLESMNQDTGDMQYQYYAPGIGLIEEVWQSSGAEAFTVTTRLNYFKGMSHYFSDHYTAQ